MKSAGCLPHTLSEMNSTESMSPETSIIKWCEKQTVFVTGGSGYLGKALLFKLLKCSVPKIFVLIREKKGMLPQERLDAIINHEIYEPLRKKDPNLRSKVVAIAGDVTEPGLAISAEDQETIRNEVTAIFHVAASVKFDDPLRDAVHYNLRSTRDLVELAKQTTQLQVFHYVSTAYSNSDHVADVNGVEERLYARKINTEKLIRFVDSSPVEVVNAMRDKVLGTCVNTYAFTKHLAEHVVNDAAEFFPIVISRPEIVLPSLYEPYPGWLDNISSPAAIICGCGKGILRVYVGPKDSPKAYVAVDMVINSIIVSSWKQAIQKKEPLIYNTEYTPTSAKQLEDICFTALKTHPLHMGIWYPHFLTVTTEAGFWILHVILHLLPGILFDVFLRLSGYKPRLVKIYRKLYLALLALLPILRMYDNFPHENYNQLKADIPEKEKALFPLDAIRDKERYIQYVAVSSLGFRKLIGDPPTVTKADLVHQKRLRILDYTLQVVVVATVLWLIPIGNIWNYFNASVQSYIDNIASPPSIGQIN